MITIAADAMGGDFAPRETVRGCVLAMEKSPDIKVLLCGREDDIKRELDGLKCDMSRLDIIHASEVIGFDESPTSAIRNKKDSSLVKALELVKQKQAGAAVSAGSTGALMTGALLLVGRIKGIDRPAIATMIPSRSGFCLLIDSGANADCKAKYLVQFAQMGSIYINRLHGVAAPRVGLVNIGSEREKGSALAKEAHESLLTCQGINFLGNVEAGQIPQGACDVAVCDGFTGNVILKYTEGFSKFLLSSIKDELMGGVVTKIGAALAKPAFDSLKKRFDPHEVGGAVLLGLNGLVVKAHGGSNDRAFMNAIGQCERFIKSDITAEIIKLGADAE